MSTTKGTTMSDTATVPQRLAYPVPEAAALLGVSVSSTWEMIASGELRSVKIAGRRLVPHDVLVQFVNQAEG